MTHAPGDAPATVPVTRLRSRSLPVEGSATGHRPFVAMVMVSPRPPHGKPHLANQGRPVSGGPGVPDRKPSSIGGPRIRRPRHTRGGFASELALFVLAARTRAIRRGLRELLPHEVPAGLLKLHGPVVLSDAPKQGDGRIQRVEEALNAVVVHLHPHPPSSQSTRGSVEADRARFVAEVAPSPSTRAATTPHRGS